MAISGCWEFQAAVGANRDQFEALGLINSINSLEAPQKNYI